MFYYRVIRITQDKVKSSSGVRDSVFILSKCLFILNVYLISLKSNLKLFFFLAVPYSLQEDHKFPNRDQTWAIAVKASSPKH